MTVIREKTIGKKYIVMASLDRDEKTGEVAVFKKGLRKGLQLRLNFPNKSRTLQLYNRLNSIKKIENWFERNRRIK